MRIIGHGIDMVAVDRIARLLAEHGDHFLSRTFTPHERRECEGRQRTAERLAARFAAKEACVKALGTGFVAGIHLTDIGVVNLSSGKPTLVLTGQAATVAANLGVVTLELSLSDTAQMAIASVIAIGH